MYITRAYRVFNQHVIDMINAIAVIEPVQEVVEPVLQMRLKNNPVALTELTVRKTGVITAHNLNQYKNRFYSLKLEEDDSDNWFKQLLYLGGWEI